MKHDPYDTHVRMSASLRCLLVLLAVVVMLPISATASTSCGTHGQHAAMQAPLGAGEVHDLWEPAIPMSEDCPHCVPNHCVVAPACGGTLAMLLAAPAKSAATMPMTSGIPVPDALRPHGLDTQPPTPPPQVSA